MNLRNPLNLNAGSVKCVIAKTIMKEFKKLDKSDYEELCKEACINFKPTSDREKDEEKLLLAVCRKVYSYLNEPLEFTPTGSTSYKYRWNLQRLVKERQSEPFDTQATVDRFVLEALNGTNKDLL